MKVSKMLEQLAEAAIGYVPTKLRYHVGLGLLKATWFVLPYIGGKCGRCGHERGIHRSRGTCELCDVMSEGGCE